MAEPTQVEMAGGAARVRCPDCGETLHMGEAVDTNHKVLLTSLGVNVDPGASCPECGLVGKVRRGRWVTTDRLRIPPGDARPARLSAWP